MHKDILIPADEFCANYNIEISFIRALHENGLIEISTVEETGFIRASQLHELERIVRLYSDLDINLEGIETILHLLKKMDVMQDEITALKNRLSLYEPGE
jgi:hypothetical protein